MAKSTPFLGRKAVAYNFKIREINTSGQFGGVKNGSSNGTRPDLLFLRALILQSINAL